MGTPGRYTDLDTDSGSKLVLVRFVGGRVSGDGVFCNQLSSLVIYPNYKIMPFPFKKFPVRPYLKRIDIKW